MEPADPQIRATLRCSGAPRQSPVSRVGLGAAGSGNRPEVGPTCQLLEILHALGMDKQLQELEQFVVDAISKRHIMPHTFSWHLIAALSVARLRERALT